MLKFFTNQLSLVIHHHHKTPNSLLYIHRCLVFNAMRVMEGYAHFFVMRNDNWWKGWFYRRFFKLGSWGSIMGIQVQPYVFLVHNGKYLYFMLFKVLKPQGFLWMILLKLSMGCFCRSLHKKKSWVFPLPKSNVFLVKWGKAH